MEDVDRVDRLLRECRCRRGADLVRADFYPRFHYEREYFTPNTPSVKIDLHVRPFRPLRYGRTVPEAAFWSEAQRVQWAGRPVAIPCPENMLIHLAVHAACHGLAELRWLYDIRCWLQRFGGCIDWEAVRDKCERWGLNLPLRRALEAVETTFEWSDPLLTDALSRLRSRCGPLERLALWQAPFGERRPVADVAVNFLCAPGIAFRLGYLKAVALPDAGHLGQIYSRRHAGWTVAAHAVRVLRGVTRPFLKKTGEAA
jgi:hypothetical protein